MPKTCWKPPGELVLFEVLTVPEPAAEAAE
jgi:hypothetical protein